MSHFEYFMAKMVTKKVKPGPAFSGYFAKAFAKSIVKIPLKLVGFICKNIFRSIVWAINTILPIWMRLIIFFMILFGVYLLLYQFKNSGGMGQIIDSIVSLITSK